MSEFDTAVRHDNMITWLELEALARGTDNQRERWGAMTLPDDELTLLARRELFKPLDGFARWAPISLRQVPHRNTCPTRVTDGPSLEKSIEFSSEPDASLSHHEWERAKEVIAAAATASRHEWCRRQGVAFKTEFRTHVGRCKGCDKGICKSSILVSVHWAGRNLSREYAL